MANRHEATATSEFGSGRRENHDSSAFYDRFKAPVISADERVNPVGDLGNGCILGDARDMGDLPDSMRRR
jgi:hypothetical protein